MAALMGSHVLLAQLPFKPQDRTVWVGDGALFFLPGNSDHASAPGVLKRSNTKVDKQLPPLPRMMKLGSAWSAGVQSAEGELYYLHCSVVEVPNPEKAPTRNLKIELYRFDQQSWKWDNKPSGTLQWPRFLTPVLLSKTRLLGIAGKADTFTKDGKAFPFAVFRLGTQGVYELDGVQECGLEKPAIQPGGKWYYPALSQLWTQAQISFSKDHVTVGTGYGLFWVFSPKGSLHRVIRLYDSLNEESLQKGELWPEALLGVQPRPDGDLLVSALSGDTLDRGTWAMAHTKGATGGKDFLERRNKALDIILTASPRVDWHVLDLQTGKVSLESPPRGFPNVLPNAQALMNFNWFFKPDGNLHLYSEKEMLQKGPSASTELPATGSKNHGTSRVSGGKS